MSTTHMMPVEVSFTPENGIWIGQCDIFGVMTQGETFLEVQENLREALLLFVESCIKRGVLRQVLEEAGLEPVQQEKSLLSTDFVLVCSYGVRKLQTSEGRHSLKVAIFMPVKIYS